MHYPQIKHLYDELEQPDRCIDVSNPGYSAQLIQVIIDSMISPIKSFDRKPADAAALVEKQRLSVMPAVSNWLKTIRT